MRMWNVAHLCHQDYGLWFHINSSIYLLINAKTSILLPPFQNVDRFDFSKFIYFAMYLDICGSLEK